MTERKWRIINGATAKAFYVKVEKYEALGYILLPNTFAVGSWGHISGYFAMMTLP